MVSKPTTSNELGVFLRARRARLRPVDVGLPTGAGFRRTPGLRREELAALAGISIDYYIRLEQGRESNPSGPILEAIARALRLNHEEHTHLYQLANHVARRQPCAPSVEREVGTGLRQMLETLRPSPAYVMSPVNDVLAANPEALALLSGIEDWPVQQRNTIRYVFLHPTARTLYADWEQAATGSVAQLRTVLAADPDAPDLADLVDELSAHSDEFVELWQRYDVRHWRPGRKTFHHPHVGDITLAVEALYHGSQRLVVYQAKPGSRDHDALILLSTATSIR